MTKSEKVIKFLQELKAKTEEAEFSQLGNGELREMFIEECKTDITYSQFHSLVKRFNDNPDIQEDVEEIEEDIKIVRMDEVTLPEGFFVPLPTGKPIDRIISNEGGPMKAAVTMVIGDPGSGKSTILVDMLASIQKFDEKTKVLYVQGEQSVYDAAYAHKYMPTTGQVDNIFLSTYANPRRALEKALETGYDVIVMDSFADILSKIQGCLGWSTKRTEAYLLDLMIKTGEGANNEGKLTSFFCIQQVTKGGEFAGSNTIKHATTAMMEVRIDKKNTDDRYVMFTKNRRCGGLINQRMYFTLNEEGEIEYDEKRYNQTLENRRKALQEEDLIEQNAEIFQSWVENAEENDQESTMTA